MFNQEGQIPVVIAEIIIAESKFNKNDPNAFDVAVGVQHRDDPNQGDYWHGEISSRLGKGNNAHKTQYQLTMEALHRIGYEGDTLDMGKLQELKGKETTAFVEGREYNGKTYYDVKFLGSSFLPQAIDPNEAFRRLQAIQQGAPMGTPPPANQQPPAGFQQAPAQQQFQQQTMPAQQTAPAARNPFAAAQ